MNNRGYVLVARGLLEHPRFKPQGAFSSLEAWLWLIESAAHTARDVLVINGRQRVVVHLEPGQLTFSVRFLAEAWQWSDKRVQRFLSALALDQSVTTQTTTGQTLITLCNWAKYQRPHAEATTQTATQSTTQTTTKRNELNEFKDIIGESAREEKTEVASSKEAAIALSRVFLQAAGFKDYADAPNNWYRAADRAALWIKAGYTERMIVAETKRIMQRGGTPKSLNFFDMVFANAHAEITQPLPVVAAALPGVAHAIRSNRRGNVSDALDGLIAQERGREGGQTQSANPRSTSAAFARLRERLELDQPSDDISGAALRPPPPL